VSRPAPPAQAIAAVTAVELRLAARRGENLFATLVIPAVVLVLFSTVAILPTGSARPVDYLLPGTIALGIIATCLVSLGITTAYDRSYGVLKRLGGSPLSRWELVAGRLLAVLLIEAIQVALLGGTARAFLGWRPDPDASLPLALLAVLLGTGAFTGLGLLLAGTLRAETVLALANVLFLGVLVVGGIFVPLSTLPGPLAAIGAALPAAPLADLLRTALGATPAGGTDVVGAAALLAGWAAGSLALAAATFRWE
jgi:ABC-2 type transport system permease protein